jgi:hypothetical protein
MLGAVWVVLAACHPEPQRPATPTLQPSSQSTPAVDEGFVVVAPGQPPVPMPQTALSLCAAYKARVAVDTSLAVPGKVTSTKDSVDWDPKSEHFLCNLVRESKPVTVTVSVQPRCCQPHSGPCSSYQTERSTTRTVVELVELDRRGKPLSSSLVFVQPEPYEAPMPYCGRRPDGLVLRDADSGDRVAQLLSRMALLEAASVPAFARLERELLERGAPPELAERARVAQRDEVRHARQMRRLASRRGLAGNKALGSFTRAKEAARTVEQLALENVVEGCVREAYGALLATYQAERAGSVELRSVFQDIAADERSHAALAEDVGDWLALQLDDGATQRIALARESALAELWASLDQYDGEPELGLPGAEVARALFTAYFGAPRHTGVA